MINSTYGQPYIQAETLGAILSNVTLPSQDLVTLPYSIVQSAPLECRSCDAFVDFVRAWEKKIHPPDVLSGVSYNIATSTGGSSLCAGAFLYSVAETLNKPTVRVTSFQPPPFYDFYKLLCNQFVRKTEWIDWVQDQEGIWRPPDDIDVQVVISPNNPTGNIVVNPVFTAPFVLVDTVYDNYIFTGVRASVNPWLWRFLNAPEPNDPVIAFVSSFSKIGFPGLRAGYLFTNHQSFLQTSLVYISSFYYGSPTYAYFSLIKNQSSVGTAYFRQIHCILNKRQKQIRKYIPASLILNVNQVAPYLFVNIDPSVFFNCGVVVDNGTVFLYPPTYSRINLMLSSVEWKRFYRILRSGCLL